jgi:pyruvate carboxylase
VRKVYAPFESGLTAPTGRVYHHEIPGGQLSNLRQQAIALGLGERFEKIEDCYAAADRMLGRLVKVTPSSKVVGDLALHLVGADVDPGDFEADPGHFDVPDSVIGFLRGELGDPPGGWPEPFRGKALEGRSAAKGVNQLTGADREGLGSDPRVTLNRLLFAGPTEEFEAHRDSYGDTSVLSSKDFFYGLEPEMEHEVDLEPGVTLLIGLEAISEPDERGFRSVLATLNGQLRPVQVRDRSVASEVKAAEKADRSNSRHVAAPFAGVVTLAVEEGQEISSGHTVATIEAMKMEAGITAPTAGTVTRLAIGPVQQVEGGDLLLELS